MNTSSDSARTPASRSEVCPFSYAEVPTPGHSAHGRTGKPAADIACDFADSGSPATEEDDAILQQRLAYEKGVREGETKARAAFEGHIANERSAVRKAVETFSTQNQAYYQRVELEIVQLALSIARKILHREALIDPMLLAGIVRVVLSKMQAGTKVALRVQGSRVAGWREFFTHHMEGRDLPEVIEDPSLEPDTCTIETALGITDLGLEIQLKEIERGLLDLLAQRPQAALAPTPGS